MPDTHRDSGAPHLQVVWRDDGNVAGLDTGIHQRLDVQADEAHFTWREMGDSSARGGARLAHLFFKRFSVCADRLLSHWA